MKRKEITTYKNGKKCILKEETKRSNINHIFGPEQSIYFNDEIITVQFEQGNEERVKNMATKVY